MARYKRKKSGKINNKDLLNKKLTVRVTAEDKLILKEIQSDMEKPVSRAAIMRHALYECYPEYFNKR